MSSATTVPTRLQEQARTSNGASATAIYSMVAAIVRRRAEPGGCLLDIGCGSGKLWHHLKDYFLQYVGVDAVRYPSLPAVCQFHEADLNRGVPLPDAQADVVAAVEVIEHLENPRALFRELTRLAKPGGLIIVTTPNQLSFLSKATLVLKNQFNAFQQSCYPAHLTALLETDLVRMAGECNLAEVRIDYSQRGRVPLTGLHWPAWLGFSGRPFSDNIALSALKPNA